MTETLNLTLPTPKRYKITLKKGKTVSLAANSFLYDGEEWFLFYAEETKALNTALLRHAPPAPIYQINSKKVISVEEEGIDIRSS
jgi:hypothetical protein